jgi:hypothetical protein
MPMKPRIIRTESPRLEWTLLGILYGVRTERVAVWFQRSAGDGSWPTPDLYYGIQTSDGFSEAVGGSSDPEWSSTLPGRAEGYRIMVGC